MHSAEQLAKLIMTASLKEEKEKKKRKPTQAQIFVIQFKKPNKKMRKKKK